MDVRRLDLNLLTTLAALFAERSVSRAAQHLHVSQSTVSLALAKLRDFFGDELFVRAGTRMLPTPRAEALRDPVNRLMALLDREILSPAAFLPETTDRRFTISTSDIGELVFMPTLLAALAARAPGATICSVSMAPVALHKAMEAGDVDLAIGYFPDFHGNAFYEQRLFDHPFACLVRTGHPVIADSLSLGQFLDADHAVIAAEGRFQEIFERALLDQGLSRRVVFRSQHFMTAPLLVAHTDLIVTVPRAVALAYSRLAALTLLEPPFPIPRIVLKQFWHRRVHADPAIVWLRQLMGDLFLNRDPSETGGSPIFAR